MKKVIFLSSMFLMSCGSSNPEDIGLFKPAECSLPSPVMETVQFTPPLVTKEEVGSSSSDLAFTSGSTEATVKIAEKIKKTADINISVDEYKLARAAIEKIVKAGNAYISGENEERSIYSISNYMVIRVPNKAFDGMVSNLSAVASHVNSKNVYMEDVTAEYVDIITRLKTKKEVEKRYLDILKKAVKVTDILEVEEQLRVIQEEIEAKEGQLKFLNDQVNYSTINLNFHQNFEFTPQEEAGFWGRVSNAFGNGWNALLACLLRIVYAWPWWIIGVATLLFIVRFIKRKRKKAN